MKKKLLAFLLAVVMIVPLMAFHTSAATITATYDFDGGEDAVKANSSLIHASSGNNCKLGGTGYGLEIKTGRNGEIARRTKLLPISEGGATLPAGEYTFSIWMRHNSASSSDWITKGTAKEASLLLIFYSPDVKESELSLADHTETDGTVTTIISNPQATDNTPKFTKGESDADHITTNDNNATKDWYRYEVTVTLTEGCSQMAFWMYNSNVTDKDWYAYLDNFSVNVTEAEGATFRGVQESAADTTFNVRFLATLDDYTKYDEVGFELSLAGAAEKNATDFACYKIYSKILGSTDNGIDKEYTANGLLGSYIYGYTLKGIPVDTTDGAENYVFTVRTYTIAAGESEPEYGAAYTVTYTAAGAFVSCVAAA